MVILRNRGWLACILIALSVLLTACSREFVVKPSGSINGPIVFSFYKSMEATEPAAFNIVEFVVQEKKSDSVWVAVWELKGKQSLNAITYGKSYDRLKEVVSAKSLSQGAKYRVLVSELGRTSPIGYSGVYFAFDQGGAVIVTNP